MVAEAPETRVCNFSIIPFADSKDAENQIAEFKREFHESFAIKKVGIGYVLSSGWEVYDAMGLVVHRNSRVEGGREAFSEISRLPEYNSLIY